jgi:hypothetical protein
MKRLTEPTPQLVQNCWGKDVHIVMSDHEVEVGDVGVNKPNYMGAARCVYRFSKDDVGRHIREDSSFGGCWYFID